MHATRRLSLWLCLILASVFAAGCGEYMKGNSALRDGQPGEAAAHYRQALGGSSDSLARARLGLALAWDGKPKEAETVLREALASKPSDVAATYYLSGALACQGKAAEAAATLNAVHDSLKPYYAAELRSEGAVALRAGMNCPLLAKTLWQIQGTAEDNQFKREQRERTSSR